MRASSGYEGESNGNDCSSTMCQCTVFTFAYVSDWITRFSVATVSKWRLESSSTSRCGKRGLSSTCHGACATWYDFESNSNMTNLSWGIAEH